MTSSDPLDHAQPEPDRDTSPAQTLLARVAGLIADGAQGVLQDAHGALQVPGCGVLQTVKGALVCTPYLTSREAMAYLRLSSPKALDNVRRRYRIPCCKVGHLVRYDVRDLDAWLRDPRLVQDAGRRRKGAA